MFFHNLKRDLINNLVVINAFKTAGYNYCFGGSKYLETLTNELVFGL
jgi:hypothetical protein